ncbi:hypothetical protein KP509_32G013400 [Ceratopteris richardii]|uniref:DUF4408 domain-containing protein n=1 Tax=Ceratopteris richardii TaxID=49495 RepID=A0A8T2QSW8_CERRI|nr:hypothetical protein KP509_32G013400 [Ceratopteris richardii]
MAFGGFCYTYPDLVTSCIAAIFDAFAAFRSRLTTPVLFLLMNGVVLSLAFTSGFLTQKQELRSEEEVEDLAKPVKRKTQNIDECEEEEGGAEKYEEDDDFYPELLSSLFGEGVTAARRRPILRRSISEPLAERKARSSNPSFRSSLSQKLSPSPSLFTSLSPPKSLSSPQPAVKISRLVDIDPNEPTIEPKKPLSVSQAPNANGEDKDVDQRADAFIGGFYKNLKEQQVDPFIERLERSY